MGSVSHYGHTSREKTVKKTIEVIARNRDAPSVQTLSMSTPAAPNNVTSASSTPSLNAASLLWIPYVLIALIFIVFLGANFWCYHKKHRERYLRKRDEKRVKDGLHERRRITALMRSHFQSTFMTKSSTDTAIADVVAAEERGAGGTSENQPPDGLVVHHMHLSSSAPESGLKVSPVKSIGEPSLWTGQNGAVRTNSVVCSIKSETSNGSLVH